MYWEKVLDDSGRSYFWNTRTNEVTWTDPRGEKAYVRTRFSVLGKTIRLELSLCRERHTIVDRIWKQLAQKELDFRDLSNTFRNFVLRKSYRTILYSSMSHVLHKWRHTVFLFHFLDMQKSAVYLVKWEERQRQNEGVHLAMKKIMGENRLLTHELAQCKINLADMSYHFLNQSKKC